MPCTHETEKSGPCGQQSFGELCYYHQRIVDGVMRPLAEDLSPEELDATMGGRHHGDGRRLDQYVSELGR